MFLNRVAGEAVFTVEVDVGRVEILDSIGWEGIGRDWDSTRLRIGARELRRKRNELWDMAAGQVQRQ
jgi:hypothetical protein